MKKISGLFVLLCMAVLGLLYMEKQKNKVSFVDGKDCPIAVEISYDMGKIRLEPWYDDQKGLWYVFFPSYITSKKIDQGKMAYGDILINEEVIDRGFLWENNSVYELTYGEHQIQISFLESDNLSSIFIETDSRNNEIIRAEKENIEEGNILSLSHTGKIEYHGKMHISGHGNAWQFYDKRAYDVELRNQGTLAGIDGGSKWKLLHLSNDGDKIHSKLAFDIADLLGAEYTPQAIWVNLYLNGEYHGMYLLTTAARDQNVFKTPSAVFLEKDLQDRYEIEEHIVSAEGNGFVIHRPNEVSEEEKGDILETVNQIEESIARGVLDHNLIDPDSFAIQFLVDEIALNSDGFETSTYLYQLAEGNPFYAGPAWDYDAAFGEALHMNPTLSNVGGSVLDGEPTELTWYQNLYNQPEFLSIVIEKYKEALPGLKELYEETIDLYSKYIKTSVKNDEIRWKGNFKTIPKTGVYQSWENNLRYLKYFTMNRYNALKNRWGIEAEDLVWNRDEEKHNVKILYSGEEYECFITDGECPEVLYDQKNTKIEINHQKRDSQIGEDKKRENNGVRISLSPDAKIKFQYSEEEYTPYLPILEEVVLKIEKEVKVETTETNKIVHIPKEVFAENYPFVSIFVSDASGENTTVQTMEELKEDIFLEFEKEALGFVGIYVFSDETASEVIEEVIIEY